MVFRITNFYTGSLPVTVLVDGSKYTSNEDGEFIDPSLDLARMLEGMPEWDRVEGQSPFGPNSIVARA